MRKLIGGLLIAGLFSCENLPMAAKILQDEGFKDIQYQVCEGAVCPSKYFWTTCFTATYQSRAVRGTLCFNPKEAEVSLDDNRD